MDLDPDSLSQLDEELIFVEVWLFKRLIQQNFDVTIFSYSVEFMTPLHLC